MKKQILKISSLIAFLAFAIPMSVMAQGKVWSIGPEIGVNFSKYGNDASNTEFKPGLLGGLFLTYSIENTFAFTGKVLFSQKGSGSSINDNKQTLNYIEVPLIARFFFNREGKFRPNLFVGPSLGFLTGASTRNGSDDRVKIENYSDIFNAFDFGLTGGLGFNYLIANETRFLIDARYTHGLSDVTKAASVINNRAIGITAGVSFGL